MIKTLLCAAAVLGIALPAYAVTVTSTAFDSVPAGEHVFDNFEHAAPGVTLSGSYTIDAMSVSGIRAEPAGDTSKYFATPGSTDSLPGSATIDFTSYLRGHTLTKLSFYWGSVDRYNTLTLLGTGLTGQTVFTGSDINNPANGDQSSGATNRRVDFTFGPGEHVTGLQLGSSSRAFEIDNIAGNVPEPASWAMLLVGFGLVGSAVRMRSRTVAA